MWELREKSGSARLGHAATTVARAAKPAPKFVETAVRTAQTHQAAECVMEWEASGGTLRLELKAMPVEDIARLARSLITA